MSIVNNNFNLSKFLLFFDILNKNLFFNKNGHAY